MFRSLLLSPCLALLTLPSFSQAAPPAVVTFYSHGVFLNKSLLGSKHFVFTGIVWDNNQALLNFESFVNHNDKFVSINLAPGNHVFSANFDEEGPSKNNQLTIRLEPGKQYFIRAQRDSETLHITTWGSGRLETVTCADAYKDLRNPRRLPLKSVAKAKQASVVDSELLPVCSEAAP